MENNKNSLNINISSLTMVKVLLIILVIYFLYLIKDIIAILFVSIIFASALGPTVTWLQKRKIPRTISVIFIYFSLFIVFSSAIYLIIPPIVGQVQELSVNFPVFLEKITSSLSVLRDYTSEHRIFDNIQDSIGNFGSNLQGAAGGVFSTVSGIFGSILSFFLILVITFYMLIEENAMKKIIWSIAPVSHQPYIIQLLSRMQNKIGLWMRGQLILSLIMFILTYLGLSILGVEYALILALIAGLTEFVPYLGPIMAAIPAVFLAFTQSSMLALFVLALYYIIQMVENHIVVPKIMQKVVGLNPIVSIVVLLIGFKIAGIIGTILSIPIATAVSVFAKDIFDRKPFESQQTSN